MGKVLVSSFSLVQHEQAGLAVLLKIIFQFVFGYAGELGKFI
jgi:hypothetical protein